MWKKNLYRIFDELAIKKDMKKGINNGPVYKSDANGIFSNFDLKPSLMRKYRRRKKSNKLTCEFIGKLETFVAGGELFFFLAFDAAPPPAAVFLVRFRGFFDVGSSTGVGGNTWDGFMPPENCHIS